MLTKTALQNPAFLARIKAAAVAAVRASQLPGVAQRPVCNRRGKLSVLAIHHKGKGLSFHDATDRDVTPVVLAALRRMHGNRLEHYQAMAKEASEWPGRLPTVEFDSGPISMNPQLNCYLRGALQ